MRLATIVEPGRASPRSVQVVGDHVVCFDAGVGVLDVLLAAERPVPTGPEYRLAEVELLAPFVPRTVFGVGMNYVKHLEETSTPIPDEPVVYLKGPASVTGPAGPVVRPAGVEQLDYEGELALVIGADGEVAGYAVANDISARDFRSDWQLTRHKAGDTFCPWGPWVTTADEDVDPYALRIRTWIDGELRQDANTAEMVFRADVILPYIRRTITLQPGDVIITGTPAGVGIGFDPPRYLRAGQRVRIEIEQLGSIEHEVVDA